METLETLETRKVEHSLLFPASMTAVFAALLGIVTIRHEMFRDELQAWLIARDSHSLFDLFHNLRYEGHPALWQLILYIPAHVSWNPISMQLVNYAFAVCEAFLIFSFRKLHWAVHTLLAFSFFIFYDFGAIARNYMLAALLLTAATLCLFEANRRVLGVVLLALAINTHFFAIPIALLLYGTAIWRNTANRFSTRFLTPRLCCDAMVLALSTAAAYFTIRPPADSYTPQYKTGSLGLADFVLISLGRAWKAFIPAPERLLYSLKADWLIPREHVSLMACIVSIIMLAGVAVYLQSVKARVFFLSASVVECVLFAATVHVAPMRHYGFLFVCLIIALIIDAEVRDEHVTSTQRPNTASVVILFTILGAQCLAVLPAAALEILKPYSNAQSVSTWLNQQGLSQNPMVIQPDVLGASILGYMQRPSAYYPACRCERSFVIWNREREVQRSVTAEELASLGQQYGRPVVLVTNQELTATDITSLHIRLLHSFSRATIYPDEVFYVYMQAE